LRSTSRQLAWLAFILAVVVTAAACGSSDDGDAADNPAVTSPTASAAVDYSSLTGTLNGGGSSFQDTLQQAVIAAFADVAGGLTVNYAKSSSGDGIAKLASDSIQFAGTDRPVKDGELSGGFLYFPVAAAPITVSFNLPGISELKLSGPTVAGLFAGSITSWDDPAITADNGTAVAATPVTVCRRSKDSGTTNNFTTYLDAVAPDVWTLDVGGTVSNWPANSQGGETNSDVANCVKATAGAVGYVDVADAIKAGVSYAQVRNEAGNYVTADLAGTQAALASATVEDNLIFDPLNAGGAEAYPITSPTWVVVKTDQPDDARATALRGYLGYLLTDGQDLTAGAGYAGLPSELRSRAVAQLDRLAPPTT